MEQIQTSNAFLGKEKEGKLLFKFAFPCVLSLIIQSLYNLVDQIFIGHCITLGTAGNAATGIVYPLTIIALGVGLWLGDGTSACISINQGTGNTKTAANSVGTAIFVGAIFSIIMTVICLAFKTQILTTIGASGDILQKSSEYSNFIFYGFLFFILACIMNPIVRADGSPKFAMLAMTSGAIINIIFDPIFIFGCNMGMKGAALATFIGQVITFVLHVAYFFKAKTFKLKIKDFLPKSKILLSILKFGISSFLTQFSIVIISIINNVLLVKFSSSSGYDVKITQGVITLAFKVFGIIISIIVGIAAGGQPILGYNYGAQKLDRVRKTIKYIIVSSAIVGIVATILFEFCAQIFLFIFGNGGEGVDSVAYAAFTIKTFRIYLGFILLTCIIKVLSILFQSLGQPLKAATISLCRDVIFLVPLEIILANVGGIDLLLWSAPISDCLCFVLGGFLFIKFYFRELKVKLKTPEEIDCLS